MLLHAKSVEGQDLESAVLIDTKTDRRIHEHLSNPNDVITEDDIRNIVTSIAAPVPHNWMADSELADLLKFNCLQFLPIIPLNISNCLMWHLFPQFKIVVRLLL